MAVIKAVSSKAGIGQAIDYVTKEEKTEEKLVSGLHCEAETAKEEMQATKELWEKTGGRTYKHFVQSYHKDEKISPEQAHQNALQLAENTPAWNGFEILVATHKDKDHIHTHFIVNSVNYEDGHKLQWSSADLQELKERCNTQSREQGLHVPEKGKTFEGTEREETVAWKKETYQLLKQAEQGKVKSYVQDIALAVLDCKEATSSREEFIRMMGEKGYGVDWQDKHKYITYTDLAREQEGEKACKIRDNKLEKYYNMGFGKEELEHEFERNARTAEAEQSKRAASRVKPAEPDRAGEQLAEGSLSFVERELRGIDEAVKSRTSQGRAEQAERCRVEQEAHQRAEEAHRAVREQQRTASERHISRNWEPER
ncbi:MAG: relaxase/mobilization nuclease domain-containing protein [Blautia producta]|uniref:relaxase/mobilization nuclease domain-containing protein n=2 Tax=Eubacteriales TaxID=186802 RepID=UPI00291108A4|nr:relaxase/mobilization nuclease domain-containing protein [Blautia producta]